MSQKVARIGGIGAGLVFIYISFLFLSSFSLAPVIYFVTPKTVSVNQRVRIFGSFLNQRQYKREVFFGTKLLNESHIQSWNFFMIGLKLPPDSSTGLLTLYLDEHSVQTTVGVKPRSSFEKGLPTKMRYSDVTLQDSNKQAPFVPLVFSLNRENEYLPLHRVYAQTRSGHIPLSYIVHKNQFSDTKTKWKPKVDYGLASYAFLPNDTWRALVLDQSRTTIFVQEGDLPAPHPFIGDSRNFQSEARLLTAKETITSLANKNLLLKELFESDKTSTLTNARDGYRIIPHQTIWQTHRARQPFWKQNAQPTHSPAIGRNMPDSITRDLVLYSLPAMVDLRAKRTNGETYSFDELSELLTASWKESDDLSQSGGFFGENDIAILLNLLPDFSGPKGVLPSDIERFASFYSSFPSDLVRRLTIGLEYRENLQQQKKLRYDLSYRLWYEILTEERGWIPIRIIEDSPAIEQTDDQLQLSDQEQRQLRVETLPTEALISLYDVQTLLYYLRLKKSFYLPDTISIEAI